MCIGRRPTEFAEPLIAVAGLAFSVLDRVTFAI